MKTAKPGKRLDLSTPPSQSPDRQEVLIFMGETRHGGCQKMLPMIRSDSGRFVGFGQAPTIECDAVHGRFAKFLPKEYPDLHTQHVAQELLRHEPYTREPKRERRRDRGFAM